MKLRWFVTSLLIAIACGSNDHDEDVEVDDYDDFVFEAGIIGQTTLKTEIRQKRYLLYDANIGEGFNLRRDVYLRVANLVRKLQNSQHRGQQQLLDWTLVLPPWGQLYHWKSSIMDQTTNDQHDQLPWSHFFDLDSLKRHVNAIEFQDFVKINTNNDGIRTTSSAVPVTETSRYFPEWKKIDLVYELQYYKDTFEGDGKLLNWVDKVDESECLRKPAYKRDDEGTFRGPFWGHDDVYAVNFSCLSMQGPARTLIPLLLSKNVSSIMLDRSEIMLHDSYGDGEYWKARRSMRFAKRLRQVGDQFRRSHLNSTDLTDRTELPNDWRLAKPSRGSALGGPYLAVHLRRQDFLSARPKHVPSLANAAKQIREILRRLNLTKVFVATDAPTEEFQILREGLDDVIRFVPTQPQLKELKDGGVAIIDQWICAHARYFVGTHESTFSFRIQEEREILGFDPDSTFNRLCGDSELKCTQPTRWLLVYD